MKEKNIPDRGGLLVSRNEPRGQYEGCQNDLSKAQNIFADFFVQKFDWYILKCMDQSLNPFPVGLTQKT